MANDVIAVGDVIQISPTWPGHPALGGLFALVEEIRGWGVIAFVDAGEGKRAYVRCQTADYVRIGRAEWLPEDLAGKADE